MGRIEVNPTIIPILSHPPLPHSGIENNHETIHATNSNVSSKIMAFPNMSERNYRKVDHAGQHFPDDKVTMENQIVLSSVGMDYAIKLQ